MTQEESLNDMDKLKFVKMINDGLHLYNVFTFEDQYRSDGTIHIIKQKYY